MKYRVPQAAYSDRRLRGSDLRVLLALEGYTDPKGHCWPSQGRIARELDMQRPHVNRAIARLEEFGYLVRAGRSGYRSCRYFLTVPTTCTTDGTESCTTGGTQTSSGNIPPPVVPPRGDVAASAGADKSPKRRPRAARKRGGGQAAATPPPCAPRPSDRGGGVTPKASLVPADLQGAASAMALQVGRGAKSPAAPPRAPPSPIDNAKRHLSAPDWIECGVLALELKDEGEACLRFGLTREGKPPDG